MKLKELWKEVERVNKRFPSKYKPILGNGKCENPKFLFVFINPTKTNISSHSDWEGFRAPFIGTKPVWRVFHKAGLFNSQLLRVINASEIWSSRFAGLVYKSLAKRGMYLTNIVKWTGSNADLPNAAKIKAFLPLLKKEIEIVKPKYIITMGLIPFEHLTGHKIKLGEYYKEVMKTKKLKTYDLKLGSKTYKVVPCYFPVGRGDPKKAIEILKLLKTKN
jgi:DNA polymerase